MLTAIHFLLTYTCTMECDHCFVYSSPNAEGTFTIDKIRTILSELKKIGSIEWVYFEGGEPFMFYPLMIEGINLARTLGFKTGIVTNAYWATSENDALLWLKPLLESGIADLSISDDSFHYSDKDDNLAKNARSAAQKLGMPLSSICIERPTSNAAGNVSQGVSGGMLLKGRAVEKLAAGLPTRPYDEFTECPEEDLKDPKRVHCDPYGYVHICQGLVMGNVNEVPLAELAKNYRADSHPICDALLKGGPALLAKKYAIAHEERYASACHFCYLVRRALVDRFPEYLAPRLVYGLK